MKKIISIVSLLLTCFCVEMQAEDGVYFKDIKIQQGTTTATLCVNVSAETAKLGSFQIEYTLPTGVSTVATEMEDFGPACLTYNPNYTATTAFNIFSNTTNVGEDKTAVEIALSIPADIAIGEHDIVLNSWEIALADGSDKIVSAGPQTATLTVQKTAIIDEMPEGFGVIVSPFVAKDGDLTLNFNYKSAKDIKNLSFDVELPEGIFFMDDAEWDKGNVVAALTATCTGEPTFSKTLGAGDYPTSAKVNVSGTFSAKTKKYINASANYSSLATITASVMTPENEYVDDWEDAIMQKGLSTIKLANIVLEDVEGNTYKGEYLASVIYGQPAAQEAILYGNYDEATASAFTTALKNVAIADVTAATVAEGAKFNDVLVNEKGGNSYYTRTSANYGTTVLPLDLTAANVDELYMIESMDANSIVLTEAASVSANTPCIFKGTINVGGATPTLGVPSEQGLGQTTFKGTYSATSIAAGEGYYISTDGKFYSDGASVAPFRGYFDGAIAGVKEFRVSLVTPDGLIDITDQFSSEDIYNLQGIRVQNAKKGVNIVGGKKVYVK